MNILCEFPMSNLLNAFQRSFQLTRKQGCSMNNGDTKACRRSLAIGSEYIVCNHTSPKSTSR